LGFGLNEPVTKQSSVRRQTRSRLWWPDLAYGVIKLPGARSQIFKFAPDRVVLHLEGLQVSNTVRM
jgi:hypothetical protein